MEDGYWGFELETSELAGELGPRDIERGVQWVRWRAEASVQRYFS